MDEYIQNDLKDFAELIAAMTDEEKQKFFVMLTGNADRKFHGEGTPIDRAIAELEEEAAKDCPNSNCKCKNSKEE